MAEDLKPRLSVSVRGKEIKPDSSGHFRFIIRANDLMVMDPVWSDKDPFIFHNGLTINGSYTSPINLKELPNDYDIKGFSIHIALKAAQEIT